jgi:hypothetical protein
MNPGDHASIILKPDGRDSLKRLNGTIVKVGVIGLTISLVESFGGTAKSYEPPPNVFIPWDQVRRVVMPPAGVTEGE